MDEQQFKHGLAYAHMLSNFHDRAFCGNKEVLRESTEWPSTESIAAGERLGVRTVKIGNDEWLFSSGAKWMEAICGNSLTEDPDKVAGRFFRRNYQFTLFIGDQYGALLKEGNSTMTHGDIIRSLIACGSIEKRAVGGVSSYVIIKDTGYELVGNPTQLSANYSGIILPKQGDVDATYVSYWTNVSIPSLNHYVKSRYDGPFKQENSVGEFVIPFVVKDLD